MTTQTKTTKATNIYSIENGRARLHLHRGQQRAWLSDRRFVFVIAGTQGGKTSFGPWWLWREIQRRGTGDYIAATSSYDLFKLKMLPEIRDVFENILRIGRYWSGDKVIELKNPQTGQFEANRADDKMYARIILRSAASKGGLESTTAKAAWLDEVGQDEFTLSSWEAVVRRLSLSRGRVLGTTTPYNLGWLKQKIYDLWEKGDPDIDVIQFPSTLNPLFTQEEFESAQRSMQTWKFNMFYKGQFGKPAGMIYHNFRDQDKASGGHKVKPFEIPKSWARYVGVDPGAVNHAILWAAHNPEEDALYLYRESLEGGKATAEHAIGCQNIAYANQERVILYAVGQKSEIQQRIDWANAGVPNVIEPPIHDVESGIDKVVMLLKTHRLYIFDNLDLTLDQIMRYARVVDDMGNPTEKIKDKGTFHLLDALRYLVLAAFWRDEEQIVYDDIRVNIGW